MNIAVAGATGVVGRKIIEILQERNFYADNFYFFASEKSKDSTVEIYGEKIKVETLTEENLSDKKIDLAFFACPKNVSERFAPLLVNNGAFVIDNSSRFRLSKGVPLVVPSVNEDEIFNAYDGCKGIIANPNCSTIMLMPVMNALKKYGLRKMLVCTYQAVSGAGRQGVCDLKGGETQTPLKFEKPIYSNCLPKIGDYDETGYTDEENKIICESKKILGLPRLNVGATAVRVPVFNCHSESVYAEFAEKIEIDDIYSALRDAPYVKVYYDDYPTVLDADGSDFVHVGRVRKDKNADNAIWLWLVADNLRVGASLNAVKIAEVLQNSSKIDI